MIPDPVTTKQKIEAINARLAALPLDKLEGLSEKEARRIASKGRKLARSRKRLEYHQKKASK